MLVFGFSLGLKLGTECRAKIRMKDSAKLQAWVMLYNLVHFRVRVRNMLLFWVSLGLRLV